MDFVFSKEVLEQLDGKAVPLVTYIGGERRVVGEAVLRRDGKGVMVDAMSMDTHIADFLKGSPFENDH